jgi:energy-coupling factor transporter ATP-binding protein EcfA2
VAALIEVGSGVHPELTARENIWLYGQILGMPKSEIRRRFDEIVEFAELGHVLDTPLKMYSSGMQLRLGFAIASQLEPDIFVVDEALAVGDAGFQAKCVERMTKLVAEGRTLFLVSHNLPIVREVCGAGLVLEAGRVLFQGSSVEAIERYMARVSQGLSVRPRSDEPLAVLHVSVRSPAEDGRLATGSDAIVQVELKSLADLPDVQLGIGITDGRPGNLIAVSMISENRCVSLAAGTHRVTCRLESLPLLPSAYEVWFSALSAEKGAYYFHPRPVGTFFVVDGPAERRRDAMFATTGGFGPLHVPYIMEIDTLMTPRPGT